MNKKYDKKNNNKKNNNKKNNNKKKYDKKIYFKDINIHNLKPNIINYLKKKNDYTIKYNNYLLSNNGIYIFKNNILKKYHFISNILNETNQLIEMNQYYKFKNDSFNIPYDHEHIKIKEISFNINDYFLIFEIINGEINDFYIKINNSLNISDILMIKEISYIKNLLI